LTSVVKSAGKFQPGNLFILLLLMYLLRLIITSCCW